jgi:serine/threonine protein kinase
MAHGAMPLDEALPIARQIADALEAAHEHAIIHRDLKPSNIKVRSDGAVKVLDFGLAKALDPTPSGIDASQSPTITSPAATLQGVILGTAAYMAPEQARGKAVDKRADIWAFGCVLYEMLTGKRAFEGDDVSETLAAVLAREPDWGRLSATAPHGIQRLVPLPGTRSQTPPARHRRCADRAAGFRTDGEPDNCSRTVRARVPTRSHDHRGGRCRCGRDGFCCRIHVADRHCACCSDPPFASPA